MVRLALKDTIEEQVVILRRELAKGGRAGGAGSEVVLMPDLAVLINSTAFKGNAADGNTAADPELGAAGGAAAANAGNGASGSGFAAAAWGAAAGPSTRR